MPRDLKKTTAANAACDDTLLTKENRAAGLLAARLGASNVTLTDHNPICIDLMRQSVALSQPPTPSAHLSSSATATPISVSLLDWSKPVPQHLLGTAHVVLGADVIYSLEAVQALFKTVDAIMHPSSSEQVGPNHHHEQSVNDSTHMEASREPTPRPNGLDRHEVPVPRSGQHICTEHKLTSARQPSS